MSRIPTSIPNVELDSTGMIWVCGHYTGYDAESIRNFPVRDLQKLRNRELPGSYQWQFLQSYLDQRRPNLG